MPALFDPSQMQILLGSYAVGPARCLADPFLPLKAQGFKRNLSARMIALDKAAARDKLPGADSLVSRKVDGECTLLLIDRGECCSVNPGGVVRVGLPAMQEAVELLAKSKHKQALLGCELFVARDDRRPRVHDVSRVARQPRTQDELASLHCAVFDILEVDGKPAPIAYSAAYKLIESIFKPGARIRPVETVRAKSVDDVLKAYDKWVEGENAEGLVVRSDSAGSFKIKPRITIDAAVLGFTEGVDERLGMLHDALIGLMRQDRTIHILGRVGGGFTDEQRRDWLSDLKDMAVASDYAEVNDSVAYQMVRPEWVVEISVLDLINQNSRGVGVDRMVLDFDSSAEAYRAIRRLPLASPISPVFVRRRLDKLVRPDDLRLDQLAGVVEVPDADQDARALRLPASRILRREVYTKTLKGSVMVRKLLLWRTNKPAATAPAFVAYLTDFSPNRSAPLDRDIRVSNSQEQIEQLFEQLKAENIVKGWSPVSA